MIKGMNGNSPAAVWCPGQKELEWFGVFENTGYVTFDADSSTDFYAGNIVMCDPRLVVSLLSWTVTEARFRVHNPTDQSISTELATVPEIKGKMPFCAKIEVVPGTSIEIGRTLHSP